MTLALTDGERADELEKRALQVEGEAENVEKRVGIDHATLTRREAEQLRTQADEIRYGRSCPFRPDTKVIVETILGARMHDLRGVVQAARWQRYFGGDGGYWRFVILSRDAAYGVSMPPDTLKAAP